MTCVKPTLTSLSVSHDSSLVTEMRLEGPPCTHTRTDPGWSRAGRRGSRVNVGELSERSGASGGGVSYLYGMHPL